MDLMVWLPAMFVLGLASMGLFVAFVEACDRIWGCHDLRCRRRRGVPAGVPVHGPRAAGMVLGREGSRDVASTDSHARHHGGALDPAEPVCGVDHGGPVPSPSGVPVVREAPR